MTQIGAWTELTLPIPGWHNAGAVAAAFTLTLGRISRLRLTLNGAPTVLTIKDGALGFPYVLELVQGAGGTKTVTWPGSVDFGAAGAPALDTVAGKVTLVELVRVGIVPLTYYGRLLGTGF